MAGIESAVVRVVVGVSDQLSARLNDTVELPRVSNAATEGLLSDLRRQDVEALETYLDSPDFATVVAQKRAGDLAGKSSKDQLSEGLRLYGLADHLLTRVTDIVHDVMIAACQEASPLYDDTSDKISRGDLYTAATQNSALLKSLKSLTRVHAFAARLRDQVIALHCRIRMPHVGVSRSVRYDQLYVEPTLGTFLRLGAPGERVLVQGDPGAGKSTLAAKFAHDVAVGGRVPFLLVLREFATSFDEGGHDLLHYLEKLCHAPYNVKPPRDAVEYLLRTGRAVVILDGLDELVHIELRRRVVSLVEGFAHLYPLVPMLATARKVGYADAPLSTDLFVSGEIDEFDSDQVAAYVTRWFELDDATSPVERSRLVTSFLEDSASIPELRSNPLLLTLLCAMYSSDRYLPRNLAQVYERCALMMFEQWDSKRGIALPLKFHGRLRGAVQHLAWKMFNATESGKALPRGRIINVLTAYLDAKLDDHDESVAMAEEFLAYCTGRAWILTDVGAEVYGFTHRTFLEYFAAEYLVRTHRTAADLWAVLRPYINQWDVVGQIALQLYDRNVEGGVDELLTEALGDGGLGFAARSLHYVHPAKRTIRAIATAAVDASAQFPVEARLNAVFVTEADDPLFDCIRGCSSTNQRIIDQTVAARISTLLHHGEFGAALLLDHLPEFWHLTTEHHFELVDLWKSSPWAAGRFPLSEPGVLPEIVRRSGTDPLYADCSFAGRVSPSLSDTDLGPEIADLVAIEMVALPTPWPADYGSMDFSLTLRSASALHAMLALPAFEESPGDREELIAPALERDDLPSPVREYLARWMRHEISVLDRDRLPPLPPQGPR
ncbi:NACHT domain-containing protein [Lentzea sp. NPDC059081]|uniref:NACHT domain-containing protein n=1 Tax=Lentzea sp. NPDC059081 TaxID=3346719 RepID=UPI0036C3F194